MDFHILRWKDLVSDMGKIWKYIHKYIWKKKEEENVTFT